MAIPNDADKRKEVRPVICYPNETLPDPDLSELNKSKKTTCWNPFNDRCKTLVKSALKRGSYKEVPGVF